MFRSVLEERGPNAYAEVRFEKTPNGPRWTVTFKPAIGACLSTRGETLDQALRALVVKVRRAQGEKVGR
jgi:hypothetical protein